jgi:crotonobetainyl-CoA:carnitine CoA-transferase CaiB-like acyl-CoA transferase
MSKPFTGVKVLDFTRVLAGPYGSYQLALLGADVIKVESREGDDMRYGSRANEWEKRGMAAPWVAVNAGKRSITLDLKQPKAIEVIKRLVLKVDVVMENFRPGVMDKLGIGYETLKAINPKVIYCAVSGFGQVGPERATAAFDGMIQAMSGLMSITGFPTNGPTRVGFAGADVMSGATAALGVASALYQRTHTGKGQLVDVAMIDAVMGYLAQQFTEHLMTGRVHEQAQNLSVTRKPTGNLFKTRDGWMVLAVMTEPLRRLAQAHREQHRPARNRRRGDEEGDLGHLGRTVCQGRRAGWPRAFHPRDREARPHEAPHRAADGRDRAWPHPGGGLRLSPGAWRRLGRPSPGQARPAHRRRAGGSRLLGRRNRRHAQAGGGLKRNCRRRDSR